MGGIKKWIYDPDLPVDIKKATEVTQEIGSAYGEGS